MAYKISNRMKKFGVEILEELDRTIYKPTSMLWTDSLKKGEWTLVIGTMAAKIFEDSGENDLEEIIQEVFKTIENISTEDYKFNLVVVSPRHRFLLSLGSLVNTDFNAIADITLNDFLIDGVNIGANHIYRLHTQ